MNYMPYNDHHILGEIMDIYELCALRDKLIMDPNYSTKEQTLMFALLQEPILNARPGTILTY